MSHVMLAVKTQSSKALQLSTLDFKMSIFETARWFDPRNWAYVKQFISPGLVLQTSVASRAGAVMNG